MDQRDVDAILRRVDPEGAPQHGAGSAAYVEGDFFAEPEPDVRMSKPDEESFRAKQAFERERLEAWF